MTMYTLAVPLLPGDPTDAGPLPHASDDPPPDFADLCMYAQDELRDVWRLYRDVPSVQRKLRRECLERAEEYIRRAREMV